MTRYRLGAIVALAAMIGTIALDDASARRYHRVRVVRHRAPHVFVFRSPDAANLTVNAGYVAGYLLPGFIGATNADPYEKPSYGYYPGGGRGPGYSYYGD